jgi:membrane protein implicated in regulation of membrane protease activity
MENDYIKSVIKGLTVAHVCLGFAAACGVVAVIVVGWTQLPFLVEWVPVILAAVFLVVTIMLLRKDMVEQRREQR